MIVLVDFVELISVFCGVLSRGSKLCSASVLSA